MPAVRTFALYSTVAIALNFIFQITVFVALMSLDQRRFEVNNFFDLCQNIVIDNTNVALVVDQFDQFVCKKKVSLHKFNVLVLFKHFTLVFYT